VEERVAAKVVVAMAAATAEAVMAGALAVARGAAARVVARAVAKVVVAMAAAMGEVGKAVVRVVAAKAAEAKAAVVKVQRKNLSPPALQRRSRLAPQGRWRGPKPTLSGTWRLSIEPTWGTACSCERRR